MTNLEWGRCSASPKAPRSPAGTVIMALERRQARRSAGGLCRQGRCFDTGGISIKGAASMEDMKGDMGGAACVVD